MSTVEQLSLPRGLRVLHRQLRRCFRVVPFHLRPRIRDRLGRCRRALRGRIHLRLRGWGRVRSLHGGCGRILLGCRRWYFRESSLLFSVFCTSSREMERIRTTCFAMGIHPPSTIFTSSTRRNTRYQNMISRLKSLDRVSQFFNNSYSLVTKNCSRFTGCNISFSNM